MPRRELLTEPQRLAFTEPAIEERDMVRHYTLSTEDLGLIDRRAAGARTGKLRRLREPQVAQKDDEGKHGCRRLLVLA